MSLRRRLTSLVVVGLTSSLFSATLAPPAIAAAPAQSPRTYYLALGDSLGYGYKGAQIAQQAAAGEIEPSTFPGYAVPFAERLAASTGQIVEAVNLSCPGETTVTIEKACEFSGAFGRKALHDPYKSSQLDAALKFLKAHGAHTSVISLSLGSNDLTAALDACASITCLKAEIGATLSRLAEVIAQLQEAAPAAQLLLFDFYNPFASSNPISEGLIGLVNGPVQGFDAVPNVAVAEAYAAINGSGFALCDLVAICAPVFDIHPTDAGYAALADALWAAYSG